MNFAAIVAALQSLVQVVGPEALALAKLVLPVILPALQGLEQTEKAQLDAEVAKISSPDLRALVQDALNGVDVFAKAEIGNLGS